MRGFLKLSRDQATEVVTISRSVQIAASAVSCNPLFLARIQDEWWLLKEIHRTEMECGQSSPSKANPDLVRAIGLLQEAMQIISPPTKVNRFVWTSIYSLHHYRNNTAVSTAEIESQIDADWGALARLVAVLDTATSGKKKGGKIFLPYLASWICKLYAEFGIPRPALSATSPAVRLMAAIASSVGVEVSADAHRKALKEYVTIWFQ